MAILNIGEDAPGWAGPSVLLLIFVNLIPLFGTLFLGWDVGAIMLLYWMETVVIGLFNVPKILTARQPMQDETGSTSEQARGCGLLFMAAFFMVHYGIFSGGHYTFLRGMFDFPQLRALPTMDRDLTLALGGLIVSHLFSLGYNWFGKKEFEKVSPSTQMFRPYGRIVLMHVVILVGGVFVLKTEGGVGLLILLVVFKTIMDVYSHRWGHSFKEKVKTA